MRIGQLAQSSQTPIDTIRYYERLGLLPQAPRSASGYRHYQNEDVSRLRFIRRAKALGFSLAEIEELLTISAARHGDMAALRDRTAATLAAVNHRIAELERMQHGLQALLDQCPGHGALTQCPILSALEETAA
ncbi:MAG TPA: MerR family transcriptional regulator [Chiayiivirga sp.]|nr:MerR family transcriptional regulator [Chiayiivirga sp.]